MKTPAMPWYTIKPYNNGWIDITFQIQELRQLFRKTTIPSSTVGIFVSSKVQQWVPKWHTCMLHFSIWEFIVSLEK